MSEPLPVRIQSGRRVQVDGDFKFFCDRSAGGVSPVHTIVQREAANGYKRNHIDRSDARVFSAMFGEVDPISGHARASKNRGSDFIEIACQSDDGSVVVRIDVLVEDEDIFGSGDSLLDFIDDIKTSTFTEVGNAFDDRIHGTVVVLRALGRGLRRTLGLARRKEFEVAVR